MASKAAAAVASRVAAVASKVASAVRGGGSSSKAAPQSSGTREAANAARQKAESKTEGLKLVKATSKRLGRLIYLVNIPIRMQLPPRTDNLKELAFRTVPRATKLEIRKVLQMVYGMDVEKVHTLNMDGKKKYNTKRKFYYRTAAYKKVYVYLKRPITLSKDLFPLNLFYGEEKEETGSSKDGKEVRERGA